MNTRSPRTPMPGRGGHPGPAGRSRPRWPSPAPLPALVLAGVAVAACGGGSTSPPSRPAGPPPACAVVSAARLATTTHIALGAPQVRHKGATVTCTFPAPDQAQSLIVSVTGNATDQVFQVDRAEASRAHGIGRITGIGDEGFYSQDSAGGMSATTLVVRSGSHQIQVTGAATPGVLYAATARIVEALSPPTGAGGAPGTTTTTAAGPSGGGV